MVQRTVAWILERCGDDIVLMDGEESQTIRSVIQPIAQRTGTEKAPSPLGLRDEGRYLYLGPPQYPVESRHHEIVWRGRHFTVESGHPIYVGSEISHWWAVLIPKDEEA